MVLVGLYTAGGGAVGPADVTVRFGGMSVIAPAECPHALSGTGPEPKARKPAPAGRGFGWPSRHGLSSARAMFLLSIATSRRVGFNASMMPDDGPDPRRSGAVETARTLGEIDTPLRGPSGAPQGGIIRARIFEAGPVQEKCEGVSSYGLWGLCARTLCKNVVPRTDVSICTICSYGSARAGVQEKCPAAGEGGTGGVLV